MLINIVREEARLLTEWAVEVAAGPSLLWYIVIFGDSKESMDEYFGFQVSSLVLLVALFLTATSLWLLVISPSILKSLVFDVLSITLKVVEQLYLKVVEQLYLEKAGWREAPALATLAALVNQPSLRFVYFVNFFPH